MLPSVHLLRVGSRSFARSVSRPTLFGRSRRRSYAGTQQLRSRRYLPVYRCVECGAKVAPEDLPPWYAHHALCQFCDDIPF